VVELHPSKVVVVSSSLIARFFDNAHVAQLVEHILGKDEVHRFDPGRGLFGNEEGTKNTSNLIFSQYQGEFHGKGKV
jgi:hypothetical protein